MVKRNQHIIQKVQAELTIPSTERNHEKSEQLKRAVQQAVQNVEPVLTDVADDFLIRIDTLSVEFTIQNSDFDRLEELLEEAVREKIAETLQQQSGVADESLRSNLEQVSSKKSYREILSVFLKTGRLPWWVETKGLAEVEGWVTDLSAKKWISFVKTVARNNSAAIQRFVAQFPLSVVQEIVKKTVVEKFGEENLNSFLDELLQCISNQGVPDAIYRQVRADLHFKIIETALFEISQKQLTDELLISVIRANTEVEDDTWKREKIIKALKKWFKASEEPQADFWTNRLENLSTESDWNDTVEADRIKQKKDLAQLKTETNWSGEREGLTAINAGVVMLHPFLESLFKNLGYVDEGEFLNKAAQERAVCLVHYVATGEEEFPEYELLTPKFLCEWPFDSPVNRFLPLTESEKRECESLLSNCIQHWGALKNTSMDGLRQNFLRREGMLKREEFGWSLYIEQKTQDILLDKLPWNLSIIKLKWMDEMLTVHWH